MKYRILMPRSGDRDRMLASILPCGTNNRGDCLLSHIYALASLEQFRIMCDGIPDNKLCVSSPAFKALRRMARRKRGLTLTARCCMAMIALAGCAPLNLFAQQELVRSEEHTSELQSLRHL